MSDDTMTTIKILTLFQKDICLIRLLQRIRPCQPNVLYFSSYCILLHLLFLTNLYIYMLVTFYSTLHLYATEFESERGQEEKEEVMQGVGDGRERESQKWPE